jgi:hypothetical protein
MQKKSSITAKDFFGWSDKNEASAENLADELFKYMLTAETFSNGEIILKVDEAEIPTTLKIYAFHAIMERYRMHRVALQLIEKMESAF